MMSTLQNPPKLDCKSSSGQLFVPSVASTKQNLIDTLPLSKQLGVQKTTRPNDATDTLPLASDVADSVSTLEIINSSTLVDLSSTIIKPSNNVPDNIFENSALYPLPINSTVCGSLPPANFDSKYVQKLGNQPSNGPFEVNQLESPEKIERKTPKLLNTP